jgi:hypothetical protein
MRSYSATTVLYHVQNINSNRKEKAMTENEYDETFDMQMEKEHQLNVDRMRQFRLIGEQISKMPDASPKVLEIEVRYLMGIIGELETKGFIKSATANEYGELVTTRTLTKPLAELGTKIAVKLPQMQILYSYVVKPGVGPSIIPGTRPFCREMLSKPRLFSRTQIENLSKVLGYSLWDRTGGFWNMGKGKGISASCRHMWKSNVVIKK